MNLISQNIEFINALCKSHKVKSLYAFGSVLEEKAIKNPYFKKAVEKNMQLIYG